MLLFPVNPRSNRPTLFRLLLLLGWLLTACASPTPAPETPAPVVLRVADPLSLIHI